jgi:hypothetical protein
MARFASDRFEAGKQSPRAFSNRSFSEASRGPGFEDSRGEPLIP